MSRKHSSAMVMKDIENAAEVLLKLEELRACCVCVPQAERKHSLTSNG